MVSRKLLRLASRSLFATGVGIAIGACLLFAQRRWDRPHLTQDPLPPALAMESGAVASEAQEVRWLKGQLHAHSSGSGDSTTPPEEALHWYERHGYDFVVFTDHNHITRIPSTARTLAIPGVELTQNYRSCTPPPEPGMQCLFHVNAWFVSAPEKLPPFPPKLPGNDRLRAYSAAVEAAQTLGGLVQLNHPNFHHALDGPTIRALARQGVGFLEIADEASDSDNAGDAIHPSTEALWDAALSSGAKLFATATDDAHRYDGADEGDRGFVMVHSRKDPGSIRAALARGDFYASTGVLLSRLSVGADGRLEVEIDERSAPGAQGQITFIGTGGKVLRTVRGPRAQFELGRAPRGYVRATVTDGHGHLAWTQPILVP